MIIYILILLQFITVQSLRSQKPVAEKVWSVRCKTNEFVLNDCNWCWCGNDHHFKCKARVCEEVDMFGHFKDTIQAIDVGMEGHGAWRSRPTSCTPGVQYQRGTVLCVCAEDGTWPNPVCRDLFRILHSIEVTENVEESTSQSCSPTKLYLVGCNACFCPSSGKLDANLCTNRTCDDGDPVLEPKEVDLNIDNVQIQTKSDAEPVKYDSKEPHNVADTESLNVNADMEPTSAETFIRKHKKELEIYAPCNPQKLYTIGRQNCKCLANNRLTCKDFVEDTTSEAKLEQDKMPQSKTSICTRKIGTIIEKKCNMCKCTSADYMYCTTKKCISRKRNLEIAIRDMTKSGKTVTAPIDDFDCVPGTSYTRGCNTCYCKLKKRIKVIVCTVKRCWKPTLRDMTRDCVDGTTYETDCYVCTCYTIRGVKHQACKVNIKCTNTLVLKESRSESLDSLHGYCEPLHVYKEGCNTCRCLSDGKLVRCTTRACIARSLEPVEVEILPLQQAESEACPKGHSYKVECNLCFCLSNGNALCTTVDCSTQRLID